MTVAHYRIRNLDRNERALDTQNLSTALRYWDGIVKAGGTPHCLESFQASYMPSGWTKPRSVRLGALAPDIVLPIRLGRRG